MLKPLSASHYVAYEQVLVSRAAFGRVSGKTGAVFNLCSRQLSCDSTWLVTVTSTKFTLLTNNERCADRLIPRGKIMQAGDTSNHSKINIIRKSIFLLHTF